MPSLTDFINTHAASLSEALRLRMRPLHDPACDSVHPGLACLMRKPRGLQGHVVTAAAKGFDTRRCLLFGMKQGTGKTLCSMATAHVRAEGRPYTVLMVCPAHLPRKWEREIRETIPDATVVHVNGWKEWLLMATTIKQLQITKPTYFISPLSTAKLGARWVPAASTHRRSGELSCPQCFEKITHTKKGIDIPATMKWLGKVKRKCQHCQSPLWQYSRPHKVAPSLIIKKHLRNWFDYAILDESHMMRARNTIAGEAFSHFVAAAKKIMVLTGTLIAGRADDLRPTLFRTMPDKFITRGIGWNNVKRFNEVYGRIETINVKREVAKGTGHFKDGLLRRKIMPGLMPGFYKDFLADCSIFCTLEEMMQGHDMPKLEETTETIKMSLEMAVEYECMKQKLLGAYYKLKSDDYDAAVRFMATIAETLCTWPDDPTGWPSIGYTDKDGIRHEVYQPKDIEGITPKEQRLIDLIRQEKAASRQVWVFSTRDDTTARLLRLMVGQHLSCVHLHLKVLPVKREQWIRNYGPGVDCIISHPALIETGLDVFGKGDGQYGQPFNFSTLVHY